MEVLPKLVEKTKSIDLNVRHGAILAIGEAIHALSQAELADGKSGKSPSTQPSPSGEQKPLRVC